MRERTWGLSSPQGGVVRGPENAGPHPGALGPVQAGTESGVFGEREQKVVSGLDTQEKSGRTASAPAVLGPRVCAGLCHRSHRPRSRL